ncbi:MAG: hypothetical protein A3G49_05270 [Candidatus Sungbacteria bacterium RIFCSPLOWO2_12_FULL_41_11]|uniref:Uncharacterized protein n=1 Tax=Candidatus Sungbacteria bacterium RIFCSPLOWO2_12_FULL_41_11 TaxID=1802286 RepID=A0A1G2LMD0_9BACT|nr:MAG: hypothetical protein A3G49_05270 [Candidatus Sungbacteria bacterium RIFCSPLOWO2_12_FULL_41_11]
MNLKALGSSIRRGGILNAICSICWMILMENVTAKVEITRDREIESAGSVVSSVFFFRRRSVSQKTNMSGHIVYHFSTNNR